MCLISSLALPHSISASGDGKEGLSWHWEELQSMPCAQQLFDLSFVEGFSSSTDLISCCVSFKAYWFNDQPQLAGKAKESDFFWSEGNCYFKSRSADGLGLGNNISFGCFERLKSLWVADATCAGSGMLCKPDWAPQKVPQNILCLLLKVFYKPCWDECWSLCWD